VFSERALSVFVNASSITTKSRTMNELEETKQDIKDAKAALKRAEERDDRELILEINKRLNHLYLEKEKYLSTG
jgi:hypothetical protein